MKRKDVKVLLFLLGIAAFLGLYLGVYNTFTDKTAAVQSETETLEKRRDTLTTYSNNTVLYNTAIEQSRVDKEATVLKYPNDVRSEDLIMLIVDIEDQIKIPITTISITDFNLVNVFQSVVETEDGYTMQEVRLYKISATCSTTLNYSTLKQLLSYITTRTYRTTLNAISLSYDNSSGNLYGSFTIDKYYLVGLDGTYYPTPIGGVGIGTDNIFGTIKTEETDASTETAPSSDTAPADTTPEP